MKWSDPKQGGVRADFATAFDSFDRAARPAEFLERAAGALRPGGLLFLTATSGTSLEIQLLGTQSPSVVPPDRINLYSIEGLRSALAEPSWEICEISTPGLLDVQLLQEHLGATSDPNSNAEARFFKYLLEERGPECRQSLQEFLQIHRFSSHARVLARRLK
ncbi:MAG: hypothetical protein JO317_08125 [Verrucomicrobiae bacterium]|nr:hypothetical protein [Verrucomicrobiae bacterium]